jgi:hypothetical protein
MDAEARGRLTAVLLGAACDGMDNMKNYLQIRIGDRQLIVATAWRVSRSGVLFVGSDSREAELATLPALLTGLAVTAVEITAPFSDLKLLFGADTALELFADSERYESWQVVSPDGEMIIAGPGASWSWFPAPPGGEAAPNEPPSLGASGAARP